MRWQVQEAKQHFSEVIRAAQAGDAQIVTRHGEEVAVVIDITEYRRLRGEVLDFKDFMRAGPSFDDLHIERDQRSTPIIDLAE